MTQSTLVPSAMQAELIDFAQALVRIKSLSGQEREAAEFIAQRMRDLGFDEVRIDALGSVLGRIGSGPKAILFDSHIDTVAVTDEETWDVAPFSGRIVDGNLYGRGSVDMKSAAAASIYAAVLATQRGLPAATSIYVSCSVFEEDCDGENLKSMFAEFGLRPSYVIICEPSSNKIALGHKGKAQVAITAYGVSAHGSAPEKGINAIYEMAEIIQRVEKLNLELMRRPAPHGTLVMSRISSVSASLNAVPSSCEVYLDRRMVSGETEADIRAEMDGLVAGKRATWQIGALQRRSWTGRDIRYEPFHLAWKIDLDHELTRACIAAYRDCFGREPGEYDYWDFSTNAVTPVSMGIPTIGFGPGEHKQAHMRNEHCPVSEIVDACAFYARVMTAF